VATTLKQRGPWTHRALVFVFSVLFGLLVYWFLGFIVPDIGTWPGPDYQEIQERLIPPSFLQEQKTVQNQIEEVTRSIEALRQRQSVLRDSTANSERTMNQLTELQRLTLEKGLKPSPEEVDALAQSQKFFLANQTRYQQMNDEIVDLTQTREGLQEQLRSVQKNIEGRSPAVQEEYSRLATRHQMKLAAIKLAVLAPLALAAGWLFLRKRGSLYAPLIHGFGIAVLIKVGAVMHEHFPRRYFKYVLIVVAIAVVARLLVYLLRAMAHPKLEYLLKQYREAYERFLCPICGFPIRRGPLKYLFWTRSTVKKLQLPADAKLAPEEPYVCPACSTRLFEECGSCHQIRHALLPACVHCAAEKETPVPRL
jgi:hypothetical protein